MVFLSINESSLQYIPTVSKPHYDGCSSTHYRFYSSTMSQKIPYTTMISNACYVYTYPGILLVTYSNINSASHSILLQPDLLFLHKAHIPLWIISLLIMISLCVLVFLIAFSQCLNFHRMKPLLDELQSCYHDKYRWYGVVYVCTWITIQGALYKYIVFQTVILAVTLAHCLVQPYKKKWLKYV